jgi:hypothetical protein
MPPNKKIEPAKDGQFPDRTESENTEKQNFQNWPHAKVEG